MQGIIHICDIPQLTLAKAFATMVHATNQYYDDGGHLDEVTQILVDAGMDSEDDLIIARIHDTIEDIANELKHLAYDFVKLHFSPHVMQSTWALTGIGENRKARNENYYSKIEQYPPSANYKVGDRTANVEASKRNNPRKYAMYQKEDVVFSERVLGLATNQHLIDRYLRAISND